MGRRRYKRQRITLPVTISGLDQNGNRFTQSASTIEIAANGVRLRGVRCLHQVGQLVEVEYRRHHARYRVAWIGAIGGCWEGMVGLEGMSGARQLFADHLPALPVEDPTDSYQVAPEPAACPDHGAAERRDQERRQEERRRHPRHSCAGAVRMWQNGCEHAVTGRVNEISFGGCYVEIMAPMRTGTALRMEMEVCGRTLHLEGIVRTSQPMMGMGIEFTRMAPAEAEKLHRVMGELNDESAPATAPQPEQHPPPIACSAKEAGEAVLRWFGAHDTLTRQEFLKLVEQTAGAAGELAHV
jgi:PilZ domain